MPSQEEFREKLRHAVNYASMEQHAGNTPDFIVAELLADVTTALGKVIKARDKWYGRECAPGCPLWDNKLPHEHGQPPPRELQQEGGLNWQNGVPPNEHAKDCAICDGSAFTSDAKPDTEQVDQKTHEQHYAKLRALHGACLLNTNERSTIQALRSLLVAPGSDLPVDYTKTLFGYIERVLAAAEEAEETIPIITTEEFNRHAGVTR